MTIPVMRGYLPKSMRKEIEKGDYDLTTVECLTCEAEGDGYILFKSRTQAAWGPIQLMDDERHAENVGRRHEADNPDHLVVLSLIRVVL